MVNGRDVIPGDDTPHINVPRRLLIYRAGFSKLLEQAKALSIHTLVPTILLQYPENLRAVCGQVNTQKHFAEP